MYTKLYRVTCDQGRTADVFEHYDKVVAPAVSASEHYDATFFIHQFIEIEPDNWILISNYKSEEAAEAGLPLVKHIVEPMAAKFGLTVAAISSGDVVKTA